MALPSSGPLSLGQIRDEWSRGNPISLGQMYGAAEGVPASGLISIGHFYGKSNVFVLNIASNVYNPDIRTLAINAGWNQSSQVIVNITAALINTLNMRSVPYPNGIRLNISAGTRIGGERGTVSNTSITGEAGGGTAFTTRIPVEVNNAGILSGGGGAGGRGQTTWVEYSSTSGRAWGTGGSASAGQGFIGTTLTVANAEGSKAGSYDQYRGAVLGGQTQPWAQGGNSAPGASWGERGASGGDGSIGGTYSSLGAQPSDWGGLAGASVDGNAYISWVATGTRVGPIK